MKGEVIYFYAFDVADEIILSEIGGLANVKSLPMEIRNSHTLPKDVPLYKPHTIELPLLDTPMNGVPVYPELHLYEVGVVSVILRVAMQTQDLRSLMPYHRPVLDNGKTFTQAAFDICTAVVGDIRSALIQPVMQLQEPEAYTVFCLKEFGLQTTLDDWMEENRLAIAELLTESQKDSLSEMQVNEVLRIRRSYANTDLAVIDWDAALVVDLAGYEEDTLYVLELANLQLEEYKVMDRRLDRYLDKAYEDIQKRSPSLFGTYASKLRRLRTLRVDVTKLHDEVTHITKFFGDWYLARVYMGARERFHLNQWRNSVEERLRQIDTLYSVAHNELTNRRMLWMELLVVILFVIDILSLFLLKR